MELIFKKYQQNNLYNFLFVSGHQAEVNLKENSISQQVASNNETYQKEGDEGEFQKLLDLASFITSGHELFALVKYSPLLDRTSFATDYEKVSWEYELLANDFDGMGVDKGFESISQQNQNKNQPHKHTKEAVVFPVNSLKELQQLPEEDFADAFSDFNIFALHAGRKKELMELLKEMHQPTLDSFLKEEDVFIHLKKGKAVGYFSALLIKSKKDLEGQLKQYQKGASVKVEQKE